ncbi:MAG TPA: energy transducer TonB [Chitinophagaceae bacterium]
MKKILFLLLTLCLTGKGLTAQKVIDINNDSTRVFTKAEKMPMFKGGDTAWIHFLNKNLKYPPEAIDNEMKGTVIVGFIVNTDGTLSNVEAISSPGKPLSAEGIRILTLSSGNWLPATQNGQTVRCYAKKPIQFRLSVVN